MGMHGRGTRRGGVWLDREHSIVVGFAGTDPLLEQVGDRGVGFDVDVVGEAATVVVDKKNVHGFDFALCL